MELMYKRAERLAEMDRKRFYGEFKPSTDFSYLWLLQGQVSDW